MPASAHIHLTINGHQIPYTQWTWGADYPPDRRWTNGWGTAIEVPAVIEMLEMIAAGKADPLEVKEALTQAANNLTAECDPSRTGPDNNGGERCFGDCAQCVEHEAEYRRIVAEQAERARKAKDPAYEYVVTGRIAHSAGCRHVSHLAMHWPPRDEQGFRRALSHFVHKELPSSMSIKPTHEPVTKDGLRRWCEANTGPQGGRSYRACKTCKPQLP